MFKELLDGIKIFGFKKLKLDFFNQNFEIKFENLFYLNSKKLNWTTFLLFLNQKFKIEFE